MPMIQLSRIRELLTPGGSADAQEAAPVVTRDNAQLSVLFVCMGNICRSPTAEGVFRHSLSLHAPELKIYVDSAGTHAYHVGNEPDPRAQRAAQRRGIDLSALRARRVTSEDFEQFDVIVAMDRLNRVTLEEIGAAEYHDRIRLFLEFVPQLGQTDVPDPYYGGSTGFEYVLDLVEAASLGLIEDLRKRV